MIVSTFAKDWPAAFAEMNGYIAQNKLQTKETEYDFDNMREAFYGLFKGDNTGKAVVKFTPK
jgi:NADPH-dependent curcumin reductase CurA